MVDGVIRMKKKKYKEIIRLNRDVIEKLYAQNKELKREIRQHNRNKLTLIACLCDLSNKVGSECMMPESEVVQKCIEVIKENYV